MSHQHPVLYARPRLKIDRTSILWNLPPIERGKNPTLRHILLAVEEETGVSLEALLSRGRMPPFARARQMYFWLARRSTRQPTTMIGRICGGRDHSTVLHGIRRVNDHRQMFEPELSRLCAALPPATGEGEQ